ncbi:VOC family protein [Paenibacillus humicola]|uniref:VOC family protein n=1 Tax=Paenibacillus humicola TaxID=3110540 RepID=UPI00237A484D|nr:VOC family protein [Paenibacillus humicola]
MSVVLLAADVQESVAFYETLGFASEEIGGHVHMSLGAATFILHPAKQPHDVRPYSSVGGGLYFDAFCYMTPEGLKQLYELVRSSGITIVKGPHWSDTWSEMTILDNNGYRIAFGA